MIIRPAKTADIEQMQALAVSLSSYYLQHKDTAIPAWLANSFTWAEFNQRLNSGSFSHYVCEDASTIVGYLATKNGNNLYHLFVAEPHQGKGIAKALWQHAQTTLNAPVITLRSSVYAIPVYARFGFVAQGKLEEKDGVQFQVMTLAHS
jgi:GNAT superfamily N-acetyltransferase